MIALETDEIWQCAQTSDTFVGIGAIAHEITKTPSVVNLPSVGENGFQRSRVGVDVADDERAHLDIFML